MPDIVIVNTSPIFYLHRIQQLELFNKLYKTITIPTAVIKELEQGGLQGEDVPNIKNYEWIHVKQVAMPEFVKLITDLGPGETEVLLLAVENPNSLVIIDDLLARHIAKINKLKFSGTLGVLLKAKQLGYIKSVSNIVEQLTKKGFRLNDKLKQDILKIAGE